ncbi:hypothetical protein BC832DRAFT_545982 [Gaertneriomyces semiglobifer]|nr:hypothetical protein BC832DRAFT_545982 [Gaertneriomyces semiglobifer]
MSARGYFRGRGGGGGGGRGAYFKEKYGGGRSRQSREQQFRNDSNPSFAASVDTCSPRTVEDLYSLLESIDGRPYGAYRDVKGRYLFPDGKELYVDHIQSDPFAPPSKIRIRVPQVVACLPKSLYHTRIRRIATENYLLRRVYEYIKLKKYHVGNGGGGGWHSTKGGDFNIDVPGQHVMERSAVVVTDEYVEVRMTLSLPAQGRTILGRQASHLMTSVVPAIAFQTLEYSKLSSTDFKSFVDCIEDQDALRNAVVDAGLLAFARNGAILPRESGVSDRPMQGPNVVPLQSPRSLEREFVLPNCGAIRGLAIPRGIALIVGGGFHGKSTLLDALQLGAYNHVPGDGREFVVSDPMVMKVRAEDGRKVTSCDITPFIGDLPFKKDTSRFNTEDASGSTSMAANIQEALEVGCTGLLFDEDTCATNFLIKDRRMEALVKREDEPITPLISKIRSLYTEKGCASILVVGGCGSYLDVADVVISMQNYTPEDVTAKAKRIAAEIPVGLGTGDMPYGSVPVRRPVIASNINGAQTQRVEADVDENADGGSANFQAPRPPKSKALSTFLISIFGQDVNLSALEQLVHKSQANCIVDTIMQIASSRLDGRTMRELVEHVERQWDDNGLDSVSQFDCPVGNYARPRRLELAGAINRLRAGLRVA